MDQRREETVLVTGGAGYVGSILLRGLLMRGYEVVCVDNLQFGGDSLIEVWDNPAFVFERIDLTDHHDVDSVLIDHDVDAIVHLAAIVGDPACRLEPDLAIRTNRDASVHLMEAAMAAGVRKLVFASTCSNYGTMDDAEEYVDERAPLAPASLYAELKVEFEKTLLRRSDKPRRFCPTSLRLSTVYGLSPRMRFDLTVNELTKELALDRDLVVFGQQLWRPYCHVSDVSRAILAALEAAPEKVAFDVFNVGETTENYTKQMLVDELERQIPDSRIRYVRKDEDRRNYRVAFGKIKNELGFEISRTVPEGIRDILRCIRTGVIGNPDDQRYYNIPISPPG